MASEKIDINEHPARKAARLERTYVAQRRKEDWLSLWSENGIIRDPLGKSWIDPDGVGFSTPEARSKWWDDYAPAETYFNLVASFAVADSVATYVNIIVVGECNGQKYSMKVDGVWTYSVDDQGKLTSMCGYFEEDAVRKSYTPLPDRQFYAE